MFKKFISILVVATIICSVFSLGMSAAALVDTNIIYGDVNGDGKVDTTDANIALKAVAGLSSITELSAIKRCDVNGDGNITIFDARQILRSCASLANLQPTGAFSGYEGDSSIGAQNAVLYFNTALNRVKAEMPGFTRSETADVKDFKIESVSLSGINVGETAASVSEAVKEMIVRESEPEAVQTSLKGTNCDNAMSKETETYVSKLNESEALGVKFSEDKENGIITIEIALPDGDLDNISQTAFDDVFNTDILVENSENVLENVFGSTSLNDAVRKGIKNCTLKASFDKATGNVISYTTAYETDMYIKDSTIGINGGILSAQLSGITYSTSISVTYSDFQW